MADACTLLAFTHVLALLHRSAVAHQPLCHACTSSSTDPLLSMEPPGKARQERPRLPIRSCRRSCMHQSVRGPVRARAPHHTTHSENERKAAGRPVPSRTAAARLSCRPTTTRALHSAAATMPPLETTTEPCRLLVGRSNPTTTRRPAGRPAPLAFRRRALCTACIIIAFAWKELAKACPALAAASFFYTACHVLFWYFFPAGLPFAAGVFNQSCLISMQEIKKERAYMVVVQD